jgi:hypothetical protein
MGIAALRSHLPAALLLLAVNADEVTFLTSVHIVPGQALSGALDTSLHAVISK